MRTRTWNTYSNWESAKSNSAQLLTVPLVWSQQSKVCKYLLLMCNSLYSSNGYNMFCRTLWCHGDDNNTLDICVKCCYIYRLNSGVTDKIVTLTFECWPTNSNQLILESKWTFVSNLKKLPRCVSEILCIQGWDGQTNAYNWH